MARTEYYLSGMACNLLWLFVLHLSRELGYVLDDYGALVLVLKKWVMHHMLNVLERPESGYSSNFNEHIFLVFPFQN